MATAHVFESGSGQAVQLPDEFRLNGTEVEIFRRDNEIVLREKPRTMADVVALLMQIPRMFSRTFEKSGPRTTNASSDEFLGLD